MSSDVKEAFSKIYKRYDLANSILSAGRDATWRRNAVSLLLSADLADSTDSTNISHDSFQYDSPFTNHESRLYLDLCTGTGKLALEIAQRNESVEGAEQCVRLSVVGLDFSEEMLRWGRASITNYQSPVTNVLGNAMTLPFSEDLFDGVIIGFGILNIPDVKKALSEMYRVVKSGGRAIILEFSRPQSLFLLPTYNFYLKNILPLIGGFLTGERPSYSYLAQSISEFPIYEEFLQLMEKVRWRELKYYPLTFGIATVYCGRK